MRYEAQAGSDQRELDSVAGRHVSVAAGKQIDELDVSRNRPAARDDFFPHRLFRHRHLRVFESFGAILDPSLAAQTPFLSKCPSGCEGPRHWARHPVTHAPSRCSRRPEETER